jgi:hypothetical protein
MSKPKRLYVSLDSILDTRLGVMNIINSDFAFEVTSQETYYTRQTDDFISSTKGRLSKGVFNKILNNYKPAVLRASMKTKMYLFIANLCKIYIEQVVSSPSNDSFELDINTYPYNLSDQESKVIADALAKSIGSLYNINIVNFSNDQLSIDYCRENYRAMIMYNYSDWLNKHTNQIKLKPISDMVLFVPKIYFDKIPNKEELKKLDDIGMDAFELNKKILYPLIPIDYLPISLYCIDSPINKKEYSFL